MLIDRLHAELARRGYPELRPAYGFAMQAIGPRGATGTELGQRLGVSKQAAGKTVDRLVAWGYVERGSGDDAGDGRRKLIRLTPAWHRLAGRGRTDLRRAAGRVGGHAGRGTGCRPRGGAAHDGPGPGSRSTCPAGSANAVCETVGAARYWPRDLRFDPRTVRDPDGYGQGTISSAGWVAHLAGQCPIDLTGEVVGEPGDYGAQTDQVIANCLAVLEAAGAAPDEWWIV